MKKAVLCLAEQKVFRSGNPPRRGQGEIDEDEPPSRNSGKGIGRRTIRPFLPAQK